MSNPNEPAYPTTGERLIDLNTGAEQTIGRFPGLTKREAFAMAAMQGMSASDAYQEEISSDARAKGVSAWSLVAADAVQMADALLAELAKEGGQ